MASAGCFAPLAAVPARDGCAKRDLELRNRHGAQQLESATHNRVYVCTHIYIYIHRGYMGIEGKWKRKWKRLQYNSAWLWFVWEFSVRALQTQQCCRERSCNFNLCQSLDLLQLLQRLVALSLLVVSRKEGNAIPI